MNAATANLRVWINIHGSPVKVTVPQGADVRFHTFDDDGHGDWRGTDVTLSADGSGVTMTEEGRVGCPVDGTSEWECDSFIPRGFLKTNAHRGVLWPTYITSAGLWSPVRHMGDLEEWN